jgi:hypothetical protein
VRDKGPRELPAHAGALRTVERGKVSYMHGRPSMLVPRRQLARSCSAAQRSVGCLPVLHEMGDLALVVRLVDWACCCKLIRRAGCPRASRMSQA